LIIIIKTKFVKVVFAVKMKSNRIQIKFASESHFEKFSFNSETITFQEVIEYLAKKKKIDVSKKTDQITLLNID